VKLYPYFPYYSGYLNNIQKDSRYLFNVFNMMSNKKMAFIFFYGLMCVPWRNVLDDFASPSGIKGEYYGMSVRSTCLLEFRLR
jgi:hypothetical protein